MPLQLLPLEDTDVDAFMYIMWEAFSGSLMGLMYPNGLTPEIQEHRRKEALEGLRKHTDITKNMKIVDTDLPDDDLHNKIISIAKWEFFSQPRTEEELDQAEKEDVHHSHPPGVNTELLGAFFGEMTKFRGEYWGGRPFILLHILATNPDHHRRGAGSVHLNWGMEIADQQDLPIWLEASPTGRPLYARMGFKDIKELDFDAKDWGAKESLRHMCMERPAKSKRSA